MKTETQDIQSPGAVKPEPCSNCGTPLAADQRYCLNCGDRRSGVRLDFLDILSLDAAELASAAAAPAAVAAQAAERGGAEGWVRKHAGVLALSGALLLAVFGGVAIGNWAHGDSAATPARAPVIKVNGAMGSSATDDSASSGSSSSDSGSSGSKSSADSSAEKGGSGSTKGVESAAGKSSKDIEKSVDKGEPLSTGSGSGTAKDDGKPAGGGSDFETIQ